MNADHPTLFTLERFGAGDLDPVSRAAVERHVQSCAACQAELASWRDSVTAFNATMPYAAFAAAHAERSAPRSLWRFVWPLGPRVTLPMFATAAAAAALVLFVHPDTLGPLATRSKGDGAHLTYFVADPEAAGGTRLGAPGERLPSGTALQLYYEAGAATHLALVGIDGRGSAVVYYPEDGERLAPLPSGAQGRLPFRLTLDEARGAQRFYAVFAKGPLPLAPVRAAAALAARVDQDTVEKLELPPGYSQSSFWIAVP